MHEGLTFPFAIIVRDEADYKGYRTPIHCPDCQTGNLRVLSSEEVVNNFPMSRSHTWITSTSKRNYRENEWKKPKYVLLYCDKCRHYHDADERSVTHAIRTKQDKPSSIRIRGYGVFHTKRH